MTHREFGTPLEPVVADVYALTYAILGLGFLAVGLLDHRLLAVSMAGRSARRRAMPDQSASRLRASVAGMCLLITLSYLTLAGWPAEPIVLYMSLYIGTSVGMVTVGAHLHGRDRDQEFPGCQRRGRRAEGGEASGPDGADSAEQPREEIEIPSRLPDVPTFDLLGHFLLPFAVACGALVDVGTRGSGVPESARARTRRVASANRTP